jgi:hypothetical protein
LRAEPPAGSDPTAVVHTPSGRLVHPDIRLHISPATVTARAESVR